MTDWGCPGEVPAARCNYIRDEAISRATRVNSGIGRIHSISFICNDMGGFRSFREHKHRVRCATGICISLDQPSSHGYCKYLSARDLRTT
jgi:hypothetical protein